MAFLARKIKQMIARGDFRLSFHAEQRAIERFVLEADIKKCGNTASCIRYQHGHGTWKVIGKDLDGNKLTVICKLRRELLIVTIF